MAYNPTVWKNDPSTDSPINAASLNKIEQGIYDNDVAITNLKNATEEITGNSILPITGNGSFIVIGTTADITNPTSESQYHYNVIECSEGDIFTVNAVTGGSIRAWGFLGAISAGNARTVLSKSSAGITEDNKLLIAPVGATYLVINSKGDLPSFKGKLVGERLDESQKDIGYLQNDVALVEGGKKLFTNLTYGLSVGYSINKTTGTVGTTSNQRYFAQTGNYNYVKGSEKIVIRCNPKYLSEISYAFFTIDYTLIGTVITLSSGSILDNNEISVPANAHYFNIGGYATSASESQLAVDNMSVGRVVPFFYLLLDENFTSEILPAQGKAIGDIITSTGLRKLSIRLNNNNVAFVVKTGITNLFLGYGAGGATSPDEVSGTDNNKYNVAVGYEAMNRNDGGDHCTAVGYCAMKFNTTGDFNTAVGEDALYSVDSGGNNVAIGTHSGQNVKSSNNVLIGSDVARYATGLGNYNIAIGKEAMNHALRASNCIAIGYRNLDTAEDAANTISIGDSTHTSVVIAGKTIHFNEDGTVTWTSD